MLFLVLGLCLLLLFGSTWLRLCVGCVCIVTVTLSRSFRLEWISVLYIYLAVKKKINTPLLKNICFRLRV